MGLWYYTGVAAGGSTTPSADTTATTKYRDIWLDHGNKRVTLTYHKDTNTWRNKDGNDVDLAEKCVYLPKNTNSDLNPLHDGMSITVNSVVFQLYRTALFYAAAYVTGKLPARKGHRYYGRRFGLTL